MAASVQIAILANARQARREFAKTGTDLQSFGDKARDISRKAMKAAGAGLLIAGAAAVKFGKDSVKAASDSEQSIGATEQIFKRYADTVVARSNKAAAAIGVSANEYRELSNVTGSMLKSSGMPLRKVTDLTDKLNTRAADLAATFGGSTKEAIEAVSSLLRGEADPIERYGVSIKQSDVNARLAAQGLDKLEGSAKKQAEQQARLELLFGQTADAAGQFARESGTAANRAQVLSAKFENLKARAGAMLLPALVKLAGVAESKLLPALERAIEWAERNQEEFAAFGKSVASTVLPVLKTLATVVTATTKAVAALPAPVKEAGLQLGIAALAMRKIGPAATFMGQGLTLAGGSLTTFGQRLAQNRAAMTYQTTALGKARAALHGFGGATRTLAGPAGLIALTQSSQASNKTLSALGKTAGGALLGFSVGGPIGAAIGGGAGLLWGLHGALKSNDSAAGALATQSETLRAAQQRLSTVNASLRDSLNQTTGAITRQTREAVVNALQQDGMLDMANRLGVSQGVLVKAALGNKNAQGALNTELSKQSNILSGMDMASLTIAAEKYGLTIGKETQKIRERNNAVKASKKPLADLNKSMRNTGNAKPSNQFLRGMRGLAATSTKEAFGVRTRVNKNLRGAGDVKPGGTWEKLLLGGVSTARKHVGSGTKGINKNLAGTGKTKANLGPWLSSIGATLDKGRKNAKTGASSIVKNLTSGTGKAKADLGPFQTSLNNGISNGKATASSGGAGVGSALVAGASGAINAQAAAVANAAAAMVRNAVAAARAAARSKSPSKETMDLGNDMALGLALGLSKSKKPQRAARKLLRSLLKSSGGGIAGLLSLAEKHLKKFSKKNEKLLKRRVKSLRDEAKALNKNGRALDRISRKIDTQRAKVKQLTQARNQYAASIKATFVTSGDVTTLGRQEDETVSVVSLIDQLAGKVNAAKRFASLIRRLTKDGLNKTTIQQMLAAGPDAALATAEAIRSGGAGAVKQINSLTSQLATQGGNLGKQMAGKYHNSGIQAANGLLRGMQSREKALQKGARRLARKMLKAIRRTLKIKSPSGVGKAIGANFAGSIDLGANIVPLHKTGTTMARQLVRGFGEPTLSARTALADQRAHQAAGTSVTVRLTADQVSQLQRGREIQADLDAYNNAGGRRRAA